MPLHEVRFNCEVVTPMFSAGADNVTPEWRAPSVRGQMRWWFRAVCGGFTGADHREVARFERRLFGSVGNEDSDEGQSAVIVRLPPGVGGTETDSFRPVPRKGFTFEGFSPGTPFQLTLAAQPRASEEAFQCARAVFKLFCLLGGLGRRARRGFGAFQPFDWSFADADAVQQFAGRTLAEARGAVEAFTGRDPTPVDALPTPFPVLADGAATINVGQPRDWDEFIEALMWKIHEELKKKKVLKPKVLGHGGRPAQASTMLVSVVKCADGEVVPLFTNFICDTDGNPREQDFENILAFPERMSPQAQQVL